MKFIKGILFIFNIIVIAVTILSYLAPFVDPSKFWVFSFLGLVYPYLLLLNIAFVLLWLFIDKKKSLFSILIIILGYQNIKETFAFNKPQKSDGTGISILSYNMNEGYYLYKKKINKSEFIEYIDKHNSDILLVQEINSKKMHQVMNEFKDYKFNHLHKDLGTGIFSKFPIINNGHIDFNLKTNSCLWADIKIKKDTFRVYSIHFQSNQISKQADALIKELENKQKIESKNVRDILSRYKNNVQIRAIQVRKVENHIHKSPFPVIVGGDFNDPPVSYTYQRFAGFLKDAFKEKGLGFGISYSGNVPFLRIDYIMVSEKLNVIDFNTYRDNYSDHYPIKAVISNFQKNNQK